MQKYGLYPEIVGPNADYGAAETLRLNTLLERQSADVLTEQRRNIENRRTLLRHMRELAMHGRDALCAGQLDDFGALMHEGWQHKR